MKPVRLPAIFSGIRSRKDRSYALSFDTRELGGGDAAVLLGMQQAECWLFVAPSPDALDSIEVPAAKPDAGVARKTPSQRLRAVIYIYWQQLGKPGDFEPFYNQKLERLIEQYKAKLDGEEVEA